ncbi:TPA: hypothetical protein ACOTFM_002521 [Clostridium perfringens]|uniref:hypothetical protein n=1 Tax=Clostridium perfringens TaxID=1502 RepID=UPI00240DBA83|nr:hypothetical protein [Clostridium perfringens]MDK0954739.1 hypothetical protein [Clostridium perfringens]WFD85528.1 hypothetical protein P7C31_03190 [Clostridium perfringens]WFD98343.1 hypothetical protein P7D00_03190 [Clostridium perfringens]
MSKYIKDFKLSGTDYCVVTINGDEEFKNLDNKTKLAYMVDLNTSCTIVIGDILFDGCIPYNIYHESKVIVIVNDNTYILPNEEKSNESKLYINGELVYEESLEETFRNIKKIKKRDCIKINFDISRGKGGFINLNPPFCVYYCYEKHSSNSITN